jgi:hypothetical protein
VFSRGIAAEIVFYSKDESDRAKEIDASLSMLNF